MQRDDDGRTPRTRAVRRLQAEPLAHLFGITELAGGQELWRQGQAADAHRRNRKPGGHRPPTRRARGQARDAGATRHRQRARPARRWPTSASVRAHEPTRLLRLDRSARSYWARTGAHKQSAAGSSASPALGSPTAIGLSPPPSPERHGANPPSAEIFCSHRIAPICFGCRSSATTASRSSTE